VPTHTSKTNRRSAKRMALLGLLALTAVMATGCETDTFFDPSKPGYFEHTPTTLPVLTRLDVIERETTGWGQLSQPTVDDLQPGELQYRLSAGDEVRIEVFELVAQNQTEIMVRTVDPSGNIRLPNIGEVAVAGLTIAQIQKSIETRLKDLIADPLVSVVLERGQGFSFVIYGAVAQTGVYGLSKPDFKLMEALALAGGTFSSTDKIYVIRSAPLDESVADPFQNRGIGQPSMDTPDAPEGAMPTKDINDLIEQLGGGSETPKPEGSPGMIRGSYRGAQDSATDKPPIDIDELAPPPDSAPSQPSAPAGTGWVWDAQRQEWVRGTPSSTPSRIAPPRPTDRTTESNSFATRIIEIDYQALAKGEANFNVIIRPGDQIYVRPPVDGLVVIGGEIARPGVYDLPTNGQLTLSRLVDVAGGLSQLAIPSRVDLVRRVGPNREAVIRVNLAAIRNRSEPDILIKPDDHIIVGTNFFATPLAVIRNGFRMTYGFGFLLDRNFGNDVFGPPPESNPFN
jgi:polysaccharide biosynthesis/export protein